MLSGKKSLAIDHPVSWYIFQTMTCIHGPTDHPGAHACTKIAGDRTVAGYPALGNQLDDFIHIFKEIVLRFVTFGPFFDLLFHILMLLKLFTYQNGLDLPLLSAIAKHLMEKALMVSFLVDKQGIY